MKRFLLLSTLILCVAILTAQSPKREIRATWLATVGGIDWPKDKITAMTEPLRSNQIKVQKSQLTRLLDKLVAGNFNTVFFQIRPMADALYPTQYSVWSAYLTGNRGEAPGYDPLRFAIDEAHKRGLELHGWMNPYRYTNSSVTHPDTDYMKVQHPDWILSIGNESILDPGLPEVRTHIAEVTREVILSYPDIDGIVWDDYFYISTISNQDARSFAAHNPVKLSLADWRRENVNKTVKQVNDTIQKYNPAIRWGISPRGIWSVSQAAADKYGVALPKGISGADNYNSIYCDALAWLSQGTIDYISPQLYWATTPAAQAYGVLAPWWYDMATKYGRHFYASMANYRKWSNEETGKQIDINRQTDAVAPGAIFYNTTEYINLYHDVYLKNNKFTQMALTPQIDWKTGKTREAVSGIALSTTGDSICWNHPDRDLKYSIYSYPQRTVDPMGGSSYLLGVSFNRSFNVAKYATELGSNLWAICPLDKYGKEHEPAYFSIPSALPAVASSFAWYPSTNGIIVELDGIASVLVYTATGQMVWGGTVENSQEISLTQKGVYLVKINNMTLKVIR